mmetsp:Transcript_15014/g.52703  ORF Transcript_15014/g.52703 Transcript_15014/m.52703 type:complete len:290 (+) Transcript_15014:94-963(+)
MSSSSSDDESSSSESGSAPVEAKAEAKPEDKPEAQKRKAEEVAADSGSDSDDEEEDSEESGKTKQKKEKKDKKDKKGKDKKKDKKSKKNSKKSKKDKKKEKKGKVKKDKKGKKEKKGKKGKKGKRAQDNRDSVSTQFGKYGILKTEDFYNKKPEFLCWALDVKKENTDMMGQMEMKNLFKEYMEAWDSMMSKKRQTKKRGDDMSEAHSAALASFDDEKARREEVKHLQAKKHEEMITSEVRKMKGDKEKVQNMQTQARLRTQMDMLYKAGHTKEADKIAARLKPDPNPM